MFLQLHILRKTFYFEQFCCYRYEDVETLIYLHVVPFISARHKYEYKRNLFDIVAAF